MTVVRETTAMIAGMEPVLQPGSFVFVTVSDATREAQLVPLAKGTFREPEGLSLILPVEHAPQAEGAIAMRSITLTVHSALDGVGLTAAVSGALAAEGIAANIVAAFHHDHVFVPEHDADRALAVLQSLQASA
tara:strand:+ start:655 stop:1053 length:399 start_codon:yes stop_codon:yes gene_type:complete